MKIWQKLTEKGDIIWKQTISRGNLSAEQVIPHLTVQVPDTIESYAQSVPVRFGGCEIYLSYKKSETLSAELNGNSLPE